MKFNIIEGASINIDYNQFREDYLNPKLSSNEVRLKHKLSRKQYSKLSKKIREELGINKRPYFQSKNFYKHGNQWSIIKQTKKKRVYFGSLSCTEFSYEDMVQVIEHCNTLNWDIFLVKKYLEGLK